MEIINATDGYKLGHHRMYPEGTEQVYSNWTPRSNKYFPEATEGSVVFGIQYLIKEYLIKQFEKNFFNLPKKEAVEMFYRRVNNFVGIESVGYRHIEALYDLGYLPIRIKALPEGSVCPIRVPMMTITNTLPEFFWLTNYLETIISCTLWMPCTSATICEEESNEMRDVLQEITGFGSLSKCSLCTAIVENNIQYRACPYCIYQNFRDFAAPCVYHETYEAIEKSKNLDELMEAIRNRADYLEELIEKVKNDN